MDEPWGNKPDTKRQILYNFIYEGPRAVKFTETENRMMVSRGLGRTELGVIILQDEKRSGDEWWWQMHNMNVLNTTKLCT